MNSIVHASNLLLAPDNSTPEQSSGFKLFMLVAGLVIAIILFTRKGD